MKKIILVLFVLAYTALFCDDIRVFIDDGTVIEGKLIKEESDAFSVRFGGILNIIPKTRITQIDNIEILHIYDYPNLKLLPISFIAFAFSWDYFKTAGDINDTIDEIEKANEEFPEGPWQSTSDLKGERDRKIIMGSLCILTGLINTYFSLERIEVETKVNYIGLRWKF